MDYRVLEVWGSGGPPSIPLRPNTDERVQKPVHICALENRSLQQAKNEINTFYQEGKWDDYKKITNPYEYIFLSWNRRSSRSVATRQPLSRSYFKMIELWKRLNLTEELTPLVIEHEGLRTAHSAEGPGGFIEACINNSHANQAKGIAGWHNVRSNAITLRSDAKNVPGWRKAQKFLLYNILVWISDGVDGTGNILLKANQDDFVLDTMVRNPHGVHIYTADGGFDFSSDYNAQEDSIFPLLLAECLIGLRTLAAGGCMIIKCFDTTEQPTLDLIWLLSRSFRTWGLVKPHTSRAGNAERYFIGKGYLKSSYDIIALLESYQAKKRFELPILAHPVECESWKPTMKLISDLQAQIEQMEIVVIRQTLDLIKNTNPTIIKNLVRDNVNRSIQWCREHDEDITPAWLNDMDKNIAKEAQDLQNILNPPSSNQPYFYSSNTYKSTIANSIQLNNFRSGEAPVGVTPAVNPFMRLKAGRSTYINAFNST